MGLSLPQGTEPRKCFRDPIPEILDAARYLDAAVSAHLAGHVTLAQMFIEHANMRVIREWTESIWGKQTQERKYVFYRKVDGAPAYLKSVVARMPPVRDQRLLHARDGYHCRFCGIPVIRPDVRNALRRAYPIARIWGTKNTDQHAALQAMWAQYDHIVPHSRGGNNSLENLVVTCAPCNFGRMEYTLEEVGLLDPRAREVRHSTWDGLERMLPSRRI